MSLWNIFIVEESHLRHIASYNQGYKAEDKVEDLIFYRMSSFKFTAMMNLIVVTNRENQTMTIMKNRWSDFQLPWTMAGTHDIKHLNDLVDYIQEMEKRYVANELT